MFFVKFRKKTDDGQLKRMLEWWLRNYVFFGRQAGMLGLVVSFNNFSELSANESELAIKILIALISLELMTGQRKLANTVNEAYRYKHDQDLRAFTTPFGIMIPAVVIALMIFVDDTWREPATRVAYFMLGWETFVVVCLYTYVLAQKMLRIWKKRFGLHATSGVEIDMIEPQWYTNLHKASAEPEPTESPSEHYFVPTGRIEVRATSIKSDPEVTIEMREARKPPKKP